MSPDRAELNHPLRHNPSAPEGARVQAMFSAVADRYDRANRILSMGVDIWWRRQAVRALGLPRGARVLDVCAGTGDLTESLAKAGLQSTGADFCAPMIGHAVRKRQRLGADRRPEGYLVADAQRLPFPDDSFAAATVAFGIRNVEDPVQGLREMARVVQPGGKVLVLEFARPRVPLLGPAYLFYFRRILPRIGAWISGGQLGPYTYLPDSVMQFPEREGFTELMSEAGLVHSTCRLLTGGIAALYVGEVVGSPSPQRMEQVPEPEAVGPT